ncbi:hypothetical protein G7Y79_00001g003260 [Physcia stellaris]|nr:hypothetical protein G7Y79_00001g003260 [Physcia stellaris]
MEPTASSSLGYGNLLRIRSSSMEGKQQETKQIKQKLETLRATRKPAPPKMQSREYLDFLATVDTANPGETENFLNATQSQPWDKLPDLIPIGSHAGVRYFIHSCDLEIQQDWSAISGQKHDPELFAGVSQTPNRDDSKIYPGMSKYTAKQYGTDTLSDLNYGFGLGRLHHQLPNDPDTDDTGFYVILNAVDRSIWIAFDFEPHDDTGEIRTVMPEYGYEYGQLPGDEQNQMIGVQRLFGGDWTLQQPYSLDRGDPFTSGAGRAMATRLFAKPACFGEVVRAFLS